MIRQHFFISRKCFSHYPSSLRQVGPGARKAINLLNKSPPCFAQTSASWSSAQYFAEQLKIVAEELRACPELKPLPSDSDTVKTAKANANKLLSTLEGVQFLLCELGKIFTFLLTDGIVYARGYWHHEA